jgi:hypothetical protein
MLSSGISVPYSDEYRELRSNPAALEAIASLTDGQLTTWKTRPDGRPDLPRTLDAVDHFRRDANLVVPRGYQDLWPKLLWGACLLFLCDIAVRRVAPDLGRMRRSFADQWKKLRGQEVAPAPGYMEKLRSRKAEVGEQFDRTRASTRFEPTTGPPPPADEPLLTGTPPEASTRELAGSKPPGPSLGPEEKKAEPESYTDRLLKAKKKVWEERDRDKDKK